MALFEFIALMSFIFFALIPLLGAVVGLCLYDIKRQEKVKERELQFKKDIYDEVVTIRMIIEDNDLLCNEV